MHELGRQAGRKFNGIAVLTGSLLHVTAVHVDLARSSRILLVGIPMPSAECMGLYRGGLLSNRSELDAMGGMPLGV